MISPLPLYELARLTGRAPSTGQPDGRTERWAGHTRAGCPIYVWDFRPGAELWLVQAAGHRAWSVGYPRPLFELARAHGLRVEARRCERIDPTLPEMGWPDEG